MILKDNIKIIDLGLYLTKHKTLILADFHIGYEESLNKQGVLVPKFQFKDMMERLKKILKKTKPKTIVINGDLKHEFGEISKTEWKNTLELLDFLLKYGKVILIKGNHDKILEPIAKKKNLEIITSYTVGNIYICHGHRIPESKEFSKAKIIIIGHEHPAIALSDRTRTEKFKCFLKGKYKRKELIVQPSFNLVTEGTDILRDKLLSPFLHQKLINFELFLIGDKVYKFGKLKNLT